MNFNLLMMQDPEFESKLSVSIYTTWSFNLEDGGRKFPWYFITPDKLIQSLTFNYAVNSEL
jgi:hypothetical protein